MKRFIILSVFVIFVTLVFCSCASKPVVFNEALGNDDVAIIYFKSNLRITEYNGIAVDWRGPSFGSLFISIPGGDTRFVINGQTGTYNMGYTTYKNVPFDFKFENGKEYTFIINQNIVHVINGKSNSMKNHIASYNMSRGQNLIRSEGQRVRN